MTAVVEANGIAKYFGQLLAVDDLTVAVEAGEVLGILGPNGAGKTTAVRMLTTILEPSRGSFAVAGIPHTRPDEIRRRIGVLPESAGYPGGQTGEQYLTYHARLYGHSPAGAREVARSLLGELGLAERARSPISAYSRGMRQRLGIARALVNEPVAVFLDEPTLGLDPAGQRQVLRNVRAIATGAGGRRPAEHPSAQRGRGELLARADPEPRPRDRTRYRRGGREPGGGAPAGARPGGARGDRACARSARARAGRRARRGGRGRVRLAAGRARCARPEQWRPSNPDEPIRALLDAHVALRSFEVDGARLSDAFLAIVEAS